METFNDVINSDQPVLVDFFATWCQPCKMMHPILEQVKDVLGDRIRIIKVDVDKYGNSKPVWHTVGTHIDAVQAWRRTVEDKRCDATGRTVGND